MWKTPSKQRTFEIAAHHRSCCFPPNFKRQKMDAIQQFPIGCRQIDQRKGEENPIALLAAGDSQASLLENSVKGSKEGTIAVVANENLRPKPAENAAQVRQIDNVTNLVQASIKSPELKASKEQSYGSTVRHQAHCFPLNFKRPKVDAIREFPSGCGALAPRINQRKTEDRISALASGTLQAAVKPLENVVQAQQSDALIGSISQPRLPITTEVSPRIEQRRSEKGPIAFVPAGNSVAPVKPLENATEDFPTGVGSTNPVSCFKHNILANGKLHAETGHTEATFITDAKLVVGKIKGRDAFKSSSNEHAREQYKKNIVGQELNEPTVVSAEDYHGCKVREALNLFDEIYTKLMHEQKAKSMVDKTASSKIPKIAARILKKQHKWVNIGKKFGAISGIEIGDSFHYRAELVIVGLHGYFESGIDYMEKGGKLLAASVVASGRYANYMDSSGDLIYCGQGGNPAVGDKQIEDQKLERGNLALYNSVAEKNLVRVIRGVKALTTTRYIYDGLYIVNKYWKEIGEHGKQVFKFHLKRIPGQPKLNSRMPPRQHELCQRIVNKSKKNEIRNRHCVFDISQGKEKMPIPAVNSIDDEKPPTFDYITKMIYPKWYNTRQSMQSGCDCTDGCLNAKKCSCAFKNGGEIPFNDNGTIVEGKPLVYECGPSCECSSSCYNRVSQQGLRFSLEIFKTKSKRWGVRSRDFIPSGSFICEYIGVLLKDKEVEGRISSEAYLFEIRDNISGCFTIDAAQCGNVGRFINHSCTPNLQVQKVLYDHGDKRAPHIMLFATKNIPPRTEFTCDYKYI